MKGEMRRGKSRRAAPWGNGSSVLVGRLSFCSARLQADGRGRLVALARDPPPQPPSVNRRGRGDASRRRKHTASKPPRTNIFFVPPRENCRSFSQTCFARSEGPALGARRLEKDEQSSCAPFGMNLGIAFQLVTTRSKLLRQAGQARQERRRRLPRRRSRCRWCSSYRRGSEDARAFMAPHAWRRATAPRGRPRSTERSS